MQCDEILKSLETLSPIRYACAWDNVGLVVGRRSKEVQRVMITLDATGEIVARAVEQKVDLLITHHPILFSSLKQVNEEQFGSEKVLTLAENGICCYAMHTNFDAVGGMAQLAEKYLELTDTQPITDSGEETVGMGRFGRLPYPMTAEQVANHVKERFCIPYVLLYESEKNKGKVYDKIAVLPGSGKSEMQYVRQQGYELYLTGDYGHHEGLDALDMGLTVIDATHYGLEHVFISFVRDYLKEQFGERLEIVTEEPGCPARVV